MTQAQEALTKYLGFIDSDHAYIHDGIAFTAIINTGSISAAYDIAFTTPTADSGKYIHWRPIGIDTSADYIDYVMREGDSFSGGSDVTPINRNRLSSNTSEMQTFVSNATATPAGTIIQRGGIGTAGNPASRTGGGAAAAQELVLKANTNYVLTLTPAGATVANLSLFWYEEGAGIDTT
jgi:hypothetical protein